MKKYIFVLLLLLGMVIAPHISMAAGMSVVSDPSVKVIGVYNKAGGVSTYVDLTSAPMSAVRAQEPKPYPTGYVSEGSEVTGSVWDTGTSLYFQNTNPGADWIWETERAEGPASYATSSPFYDPAAYTNGRAIVFEKDFDINGIPGAATIHVAADNAYEVWINGVYLGRSSTAKVAGWETTNLREPSVATTGWQAVGHMTIPAGMLSAGKNTVKVIAANEYFWSDDGNNPSPAMRQNPYYQYNPGAVIFKMDIEYTPVSALVVTKTADTSFKRTWDWDITKSVDKTELTLAPGEQYGVNYSVLVDSSHVDSDWAVRGTITINNPNNVDAEIVGISDNMGTVVCPGDFSDLAGTLAAGATLECTYSGSLQDGTNTTNTVNVTTSGMVPGGNGEAAVVFRETPTEELDECAAVSDTYAGSLGNVCGGSGPQTFTYSRIIGPYSIPGTYGVDNTAKVVTNDSSTEDTSSARVLITVPVAGCTLTQGYWKNHADPEKHYDSAWDLITGSGGPGPNTVFFLSGISYLEVLRESPAGGNAYYQLAHQYIAAVLNQLKGASGTTEVQDALVSARGLLSVHTPAEIKGLKGNSTLRQRFIILAGILAGYNEGRTGPGHCSE